MTNTPLKPCPFCGGEAISMEADHLNGIPTVMCKDVIICGGMTQGGTLDEAIAIWNTRQPAMSDAELEAEACYLHTRADR